MWLLLLLLAVMTEGFGSCDVAASRVLQLSDRLP